MHIFLLLLMTCSALFADFEKTLIVTCATGDLGSEIAENLASDHNLILIGRNSSKLEQLREKLSQEFPGNYQTLTLDYTDIQPTAVQEAIASRPIAGLVLITPRPSFSSDILQSGDEWSRLFQATFTGPIDVLNQTLSSLSEMSKIVIISGTSSVQLSPEHGPVAVVRRMWTTYAKALSHKLGSRGIYVNVLSPGVIMTDYHVNRITKLAATSNLSFEEQLEKEIVKIPLHRHGKPEEIANSVRFLLSSDSNFVTGANLIIDGGLTTAY